MQHAFHIFEEIFPVFLIAIIASSLIDQFLSDDALKTMFARSSNFVSILLASFIGSLIPICTCGMIPLALKLHQKGLKWQSLVAFLVAGNASSIPALILTAILGWKITAIRFIASIIFGVLVAYLIALIVPKDFKLELRGEIHKHDCCGTKPDIVTQVLRDVYEISANFLPWIILAVAIAAMIETMSDTGWIVAVMGGSQNPVLASAIASVIAFPFYFCAGADVPISQELVKIGLPIGTIISFMLASPGINLTSLLVYQKAVGWNKALVFLFISVLASTMIGASLWLLK